ncbi:Uncharacterised protein [Yersinia pseudotuberculosis]|uniref:Uncharacterized protein n=1 Tax=Yersinia pseudotuberculosis TaxID=633 RepID=A0A380Q7D4_YERPU|nr:Uncharacterised protein [Yersinia pseudotuberculosis]
MSAIDITTMRGEMRWAVAQNPVIGPLLPEQAATVTCCSNGLPTNLLLGCRFPTTRIIGGALSLYYFLFANSFNCSSILFLECIVFSNALAFFK